MEVSSAIAYNGRRLGVGPPSPVNRAKLACEASACPPGRRNGAKYKKRRADRLAAVMRSCALVMSVEVVRGPVPRNVSDRNVFSFLHRNYVRRMVIGRRHFTSLFGATKNVIPLKEAPNGLGKCSLIYKWQCILKS
jgi:hypothetical protein